uniref:Uncharacterized protein n=1 Tax=Romanomermis culicivorax TaxID=13658 RepID=A0A915L6P4_ROMCU
MFQSNEASSHDQYASNDFCHSLTSQTNGSLINSQHFTTPIDPFQQKLHLQLTNNSRVNGGQSHSMAKNQQHVNKTILTQYLTGGGTSSSANRSSKSSTNSYFAMKQVMLNKLEKRNCNKSVRDSDENNNNNTNNSFIRNNSNVEELVQFIE